MKRVHIILAVLFLVFYTIGEVDAQRKKPKRSRSMKSKSRKISSYRGGFAGGFGKRSYNSIGGSINAMNYFGDLAPKPTNLSFDIAFTRPGFGIEFSRKINPRISVRGSFIYGRLRGDDNKSADPNDESGKFRYVRNLQFRNDIKELSVVGVVDLTPNTGTFLSRPDFMPYLFAGVAVIHHNPKGLVPDTDVNTGSSLPDAGKWVDLIPLGTEGQYVAGSDVSVYKKVQIAIPVGIGVRYRLNQALDLSVEMGYRHLFFDYIDDVSGNYPDLGSLNSDLTRVMADRSRESNAVESGDLRNVSSDISVVADGFYAGFGHGGDQRGNSKDNDIYVVTSIKLTYILGGSIFGGAKYR